MRTLMLALWCVILIRCGGPMPTGPPLQAATPTTLSAQKRESSLDDKSGAATRWTASTAGISGNLNVVQFLNQKIGWTANDKGILFRTIDGGTSWSPVEIERPEGAYIQSICFASPDSGSVVYQKEPDDYLDLEGHQIWVLHTSDGGVSWSTQYNGRSLVIFRIRFIDHQEGWLVGEKLLMRPTLQSDLFILHTTNGGQDWIDVSETLNNPVGITPGSDAVINIYATDSSHVMLLTSRRILETKDGGHTWRQVYSFKEDEPEQTVMKRFGVIEGANRIWVAGGADSIEGMWGTLARMEDEGSWVVTRAGGVFFNDAVFLSSNQVLACGSIPSDAANARPRAKRDGVILYSADAGNNWCIVYRTKKASLIRALTALDSTHVWAVGDSGLVLRLDSPLDK